MIKVQITKDRDGEDGESGQVDVWSEGASLSYSNGVWGLTDFRGQHGRKIIQDLDDDEVPEWVAERRGGKRGWPATAEIKFKRVGKNPMPTHN